MAILMLRECGQGPDRGWVAGAGSQPETCCSAWALLGVNGAHMVTTQAWPPAAHLLAAVPSLHIMMGLHQLKATRKL